MNINNKFIKLALPNNIKMIYSGEAERLLSNRGGTVDERIMDCYSDFQKKIYSEQWCKKVFDLINDITSMDKDVIKFVTNISKYQEMKSIVDDVSNAFKYANHLEELITEYEKNVKKTIDSYLANAYKCFFDLQNNMTKFFDVKKYYQHICLVDSMFSTRFLNYLENSAKTNRDNIAKYKSIIVEFLNISDKYFAGIKLSIEINELFNANKTLLDNVYKLNLSSNDKFYNYLKTNSNATTDLLNIFKKVDSLNQTNSNISDACKDQIAISNLKSLNNYRDTLLPLINQKDIVLCEMGIKDLLLNYNKKYQSKVNDYMQNLACSELQLMESIFQDEKGFLTCIDKMKEIIDYGEKNSSLLTNKDLKSTIQKIKNDCDKLNAAYKNKAIYNDAFAIDKEILTVIKDPQIIRTVTEMRKIKSNYKDNAYNYYSTSRNLSSRINLKYVEEKVNKLNAKITTKNKDYIKNKNIISGLIAEIHFINELERVSEYYDFMVEAPKTNNIYLTYDKYKKLDEDLKKRPFTHLSFPLTLDWNKLGTTLYNAYSKERKAEQAKAKRQKTLKAIGKVLLFPFIAIWYGLKYLGIGIFNLFKLIGLGFVAVFKGIRRVIRGIFRGLGHVFNNRGVIMLILAIVPILTTISLFFNLHIIPSGKVHYVLLGIFNVIVWIVTIIGAFKNSDEDDNKVGHIILSVILILLPITLIGFSQQLRLNIYIDLFIGVGLIIVASCANMYQCDVTPSGYNVFVFSTLAFIVGTVILNAIMHSLCHSIVLYVFYYIILTAIMFAVLVSAIVYYDAGFDEIIGTIVFYAGAIVISLAFLCFALTTKDASYLWGAIPGVIIGLIVALWGFIVECDQ